MAKKYAYFFTRQDMSPEQQLVQTAHAASRMGHAYGADPNDVHFVVIGVKNLAALEAVADILNKFSFKFIPFVEPWMNNEVTSISVMPIDENQKGPLIAFELLKFK